ncbi:MAG: phosphatase PAP2 family protein [Prevotellaceae bacterium]|jgi:hypothetical protein|nr:phosphatase PAP2 family protein [Prevotellaceae bacterium]
MNSCCLAAGATLLLIAALAIDGKASQDSTTHRGWPEYSYKNPDTDVYKLTLKSAITPITLVAAPSVGVLTGWTDKLNEEANKAAKGSGHTTVDNYLQLAPAAASLGLDVFRIYGKHNVVEKSIILATAYIIESTVTTTMKHTFREMRPDGSARNSFPSGHTATAFVGAEFLRKEYWEVSPWYGVGGYAVATLVGYLRMYNNRHWLADVVAGAGVGIFSTQCAYALYPVIRKIIFVKHTDASTSLMLLPYIYSKYIYGSSIRDVNQVGFALTMQF